MAQTNINTTNLSERIMEKIKDEPSVQDIYNHYKQGGKCDGWLCDPSAVDSFSKKLAEKGIPHACVQGTKNAIFISKEEDRGKVRDIRNDFLKQSQVVSEPSLDQLKAKNIGGEIHSINGVSETYATVFKEEAKSLKMNIALVDNKDGTFNVHYSGKDQNKANTAIMNTIVATRGTIGKFNEARMSLETSREKEIFQKIPDNQKEFYVVSHAQPNEYMHFTPSGYEHFRNERLIGDELRSNRNFQVDAHKKIDSAFVKPVVLTKEEFEKTRKLTREEFKDYVSKKHTVASPTQEDLHKMELERMARQIAEYKMSFENNELNTNFYERTVSATEFERNEYITDSRLDREEEMSLSNPKAMSPEIQSTIDKQQSLPMEDREYIDERVKEYIKEVRQTTQEIEVVEVRKEDLTENIDLMIANLAEERTSVQTHERTTEMDIEREY